MDKDEVLKQLAELKQKAEQLEKVVNSSEVETGSAVRWQPILGQYYFYLDGLGSVLRTKWDYDDIDFYRYNIGNCFKTVQEAEDYKENLLTKQKLKDLALELNNGVEIDWENENPKYLLYTDDRKRIVQNVSYDLTDLGQIYCLSKKFLSTAKKRIGEKKLIKLIKSGI